MRQTASKTDIQPMIPIAVCGMSFKIVRRRLIRVNSNFAKEDKPVLTAWLSFSWSSPLVPVESSWGYCASDDSNIYSLWLWLRFAASNVLAGRSLCATRTVALAIPYGKFDRASYAVIVVKNRITFKTLKFYFVLFGFWTAHNW